MKQNHSIQNTPATKATELFHTKKEIAKAIKVSDRFVEKLVHKGIIPSIKIGSRRLFVIEDVREALLLHYAVPASL